MADGLRYSSNLVASVTHLIGTWTGADFIASVARSEGVDIGNPSIVVITLVANGGPQRPSALSDALVTGASNVSKILSRLERDGLVERRADPLDARASLVHLTERGDDVARALVRAGDRLIDDLLADWTEADRSDFTRLMTKFDASSTAFAAGTQNPANTAGDSRAASAPHKEKEES